MLNGDSTFELNGNSFSDLIALPGSLIRPVRHYKFGVSQAAAMTGIGD